MPYATVAPASWRWIRAISIAAFVSLAVIAMAVSSNGGVTSQTSFFPSAIDAGTAGGSVSPALASLAEKHPAKRIEVLVQLRTGFTPPAAHELVTSRGGRVIRDLRIINGYAAEMRAAEAAELADDPAVRAVSTNAKVEKTGMVDPGRLATAFNQSIRAEQAWKDGYTGKGVGVAVIDTGVAGDLPDFAVSQSDSRSRVVATAAVNPSVSSPGDGFGHGTHIAGLVAGNGTNRPTGDSTYGKYAGVAPDANVISVKAGDDDGGATVLDVIDGLQFVVDFKADYNIRVANLSLRSTSPESHRTDPLDAAVESAWFKGIVVVAAAGNKGLDHDAVSYAPANDPYVITVGGVDDNGTKSISDDTLASWSSRGLTQDGFAKPDVVAPGAHIVSTLSPGSDYESLCPECVTDGSYFKVGGTSMAAAIVSGAVANVIQAHPTWTPNQIKSTLIRRSRGVTEVTSSTGSSLDGTLLDSSGSAGTTSTVVGREIALDKVLQVSSPDNAANQNLTPNTLVNATTGDIDYTRASWSRASWSEAVDALRASWSRASWSRASWSRASWSASELSCSDFERASWSRASWSSEDIAFAQEACATLMEATRASWSTADQLRASWSRASWSRASWSTSFDK